MRAFFCAYRLRSTRILGVVAIIPVVATTVTLLEGLAIELTILSRSFKLAARRTR